MTHDEAIETIYDALNICGLPCECDADHVCIRCIKINKASIALKNLSDSILRAERGD